MKRYRRTKASSGGFTLIELLVVIAVISILASLLLPVLNRAKDSVRKISCLNNLRQLAVSGTLYINDWNEYFPPYQIPSLAGSPRQVWSGPTSSYGWMDLLIDYHYMKKSINNCPAVEKATDPVLTADQSAPCNFVTYSVNGAICDNNDCLLGNTYVPFKLRQIVRLNLGMWFQDAMSTWVQNAQRPWYSYQSTIRHNQGQGTNAVFFDSHAKTVGVYTGESIYVMPRDYWLDRTTRATNNDNLYYWWPWTTYHF